MDFIVSHKNVPRVPRPLLLRLFGGLIITSMVIPLLLIDAAAIIYHGIYFRIYGIPLIPREKYIMIDRVRLRKLSWVQRWNCLYCDYANGLVAWLKAVVNTTEVYSCAIKHPSKKHPEAYEKDYFPIEKFQ